MDASKLFKSAWDHRHPFLQKQRLEAFRLVNGEGDHLPGLSMDFYSGSYFSVLKDPQWVSKKAILQKALLSLASEILPLSTPHFFWVENFPGVQREKVSMIEKKWVREGDMSFEVHLGEGLHTGLFLDQRDNRGWIRSQAKGKRVLNLFSYTGAFSVAALKGGAKEVVSVDFSKNYLGWLQRNVEHNGLGADTAPTYAMDVFEFLKRSKKRAEMYDLIIIDPPTFSRGKRIFSTEKDLGGLVALASELLRKGGHLFISINTQGLSPSQFRQEVEKGVRSLDLRILKIFSLPFDFRLSTEDSKNPSLKACWVG